MADARRMETAMIDALYFLAIPIVMLLVAIFTYQGSEQAYKIVKETNDLGEEKFEVWFQYESYSNRNWRKEQEFDTVKEAEEFIARRIKKREILKEGKFKA